MTEHHSEHLLAYVLEHPWALTRDMCGLVAGILAQHLAGQPSDPEAIRGALVARANRGPALTGTTGRDGATLIIPIYGVIAPRANMLSNISGGTTFEALTAQLRDGVADPAVKAIVFDVDSPGGNVAGATEFAREVRDAATQKPTTAIAHHLMASAVYWTMAGATQIVASPSALVGSIGVYSIHDDISKALEQRGIKREVLSAGKFKAEAVDGGPLSAEARAHIQALTNSAYGRLIADVARGRRVPPAAVQNGFGEGRVVDADQALTLGMIDRIGTLDDVLRPAPASGAAALDGHRHVLAQLAMTRHARDLAAAGRRHRWQ